jgi:hypothetical protein
MAVIFSLLRLFCSRSYGSVVSLAAIAACALAGCSNTVGSIPGTTPVATAAPGGLIQYSASKLTFSAIGKSQAQTFEISQANYYGAFAESDNCAKVATIVAVTNASGEATYTVTPIGYGSCTATFTGAGGDSVSVPIRVSKPSPYDVVVTPASLSFDATGSANAKNVMVKQSSFTGSFSESDHCSKVATIVPKSNAGGSATYTVTPVGAGDCGATFTGANGKSALLSISVTLPGSVLLSPASLSFNATGSANAKDVDVSQSGYAGAFTEKDDCSGTATVIESTNADGKATYAVTPSAAGSCTASFTGGNSVTANLPITVALPGGVSASPAPLNFEGTGSSLAQAVSVTQPGFSGTFSESNTCSSIATVATTANSGGKAAYLVTPIAAGLCEIVLGGGNSDSYTLHVSVTTTGFGIQVRSNTPRAEAAPR